MTDTGFSTALKYDIPAAVCLFLTQLCVGSSKKPPQKTAFFQVSWLFLATQALTQSAETPKPTFSS